MLRIVTLATLYPSDAQPGLGRFVEAQTVRLAARPDVDLRVISPVALPPPPFDRHPRYAALRALPEREMRQAVRVYRPRAGLLPGVGGMFNPGFVSRAAMPVLTELRREGFAFDVIDAQFFFPDGPAAMRLARAFDVPFSIKARGSDIEYWGQRFDTRAAVHRAAHAAGGLLSVSAALRNRMIELGLPTASVHYTGVDLDRFGRVDRTAAKSALGITGPLVVSIGNLVALKGHDIVIAAVASLPGVSLWIAGDGPERARLAALIATSGAADRIRLLGAVPHDDVPSLLAAADVVALASEREGLANVWVEALACGTPVVAPDIGSAREVIDRPAAGRIVARTSAAFSAAITELLAAPPGPAGAREAALRFGWDRNSNALFDHLARTAGHHDESQDPPPGIPRPTRS